MPFIRRPSHWLVLAAFGTAFWLTFRVIAAPPAAPPIRVDLADEGGIRDPALEVMIARFAGEARTKHEAGRGR